MLKDITLGQYFPGNTIVHRLDPRTKLLLTIVFVAALFLIKSWSGYALMAVLLISVIIASAINLKTIVRSLKPIIIVIAMMTFFNMFFTPGENVIFSVWILKLTREGLIIAAQMVLRFVMLFTGTFFLTYTTSPLALTDGIESLMNPLKKVKFPSHELAMIMSIALRFIPTLIEETDRIMSAQKARGADFETGGVIKRAKALLPVLIPLFVGAIRRADELAEAMDSRCYNGGDGRTRMKKLEMRHFDYIALVCGVSTIFAVLALNRLP